MKDIFFWVYVVSAVLAFLYLCVITPIAIAHFSKDCVAVGMVRYNRKNNPARQIICLIKCAAIIAVPVYNTFLVSVWLTQTEKLMEIWEGAARRRYCYPEELP